MVQCVFASFFPWLWSMVSPLLPFFLWFVSSFSRVVLMFRFFSVSFSFSFLFFLFLLVLLVLLVLLFCMVFSSLLPPPSPFPSPSPSVSPAHPSSPPSSSSFCWWQCCWCYHMVTVPTRCSAWAANNQPKGFARQPAFLFNACSATSRNNSWDKAGTHPYNGQKIQEGPRMPKPKTDKQNVDFTHRKSRTDREKSSKSGDLHWVKYGSYNNKGSMVPSYGWDCIPNVVLANGYTEWLTEGSYTSTSQVSNSPSPFFNYIYMHIYIYIYIFTHIHTHTYSHCLHTHVFPLVLMVEATTRQLH